MEINKRVNKLRSLMKSKGITAYIIPTSDPHQSEYVAEHYKGRAWVSGFTGSAGTVVITQEDANLWADGRYFIQAENQIKDSEYKLFKMGVSGVPTYIQWLKDNIKNGQAIGFDGKVFAQTTVEKLEREFEDADVEFIDEYDLLGEIWEDRPSLSKGEAFIHEEKYTGISASEKIEKVRENMKDKGVDYSLIASLDDIAWLYNIRGKDVKGNPIIISYALISMDKSYLFVDKDKINNQVESFLNDNGIIIKAYEDVINYVENIDSDATVTLEKGKTNSWLFNGLPKTCNIIDEMNYTTILKREKE